MKKYIEFSALEKWILTETASLDGEEDRQYVVERLRNELHAADVRHVVRGRWNRTDAYPHRLYCSACYKTYLKNDELLERLEVPLNFCPNCGADMREES